MENKKEFKFAADQLLCMVDFIKWTSSFPGGVIKQMSTPLDGIAISPQANDLFAIAKDDIGWMLVMHENEGAWMKSLPISAVLMGYNDGLILVTDKVKMLDQPFEMFGISVFIPNITLREELLKCKLFGLGLAGKGKPAERVNKLVPVYTPETAQELKISPSNNQYSRLFS